MVVRRAVALRTIPSTKIVYSDSDIHYRNLYHVRYCYDFRFYFHFDQIRVFAVAVVAAASGAVVATAAALGQPAKSSSRRATGIRKSSQSAPLSKIAVSGARPQLSCDKLSTIKFGEACMPRCYHRISGCGAILLNKLKNFRMT